jgi:Tfp pilus assembly protein PilZ
MTGSERRRHPRYKASLEAQLALGAERFTGRLKDICRDAVLVEVTRSLAHGDEVALALELPGAGGPLQVVGHVVRIAPGEHGGQDAAILFSDLTPAAETRIDFFIGHQAQRTAEESPPGSK